jgi:hypothetical protein
MSRLSEWIRDRWSSAEMSDETIRFYLKGATVPIMKVVWHEVKQLALERASMLTGPQKAEVVRALLMALTTRMGVKVPTRVLNYIIEYVVIRVKREIEARAAAH